MVLGAGWLLTLTASHNWAAWGGRGYTGPGSSQPPQPEAEDTSNHHCSPNKAADKMSPKHAQNPDICSKFQNVPKYQVCPTPQYNPSKIRGQGQLTTPSTSRRSIGTLRSQTLGEHHTISGPTIAYTMSKEQHKTKIRKK